MSVHIDEHTIELYVLDSSTLGEELRQRVADHLGRCVSCADLEQRFRSFYADVEKELQRPATERDAAFAEALLAGRRPSLPERGLTRQSKQLRDELDRVSADVSSRSHSVVRRFSNLVRTYPVRSGVVAAMSFAGMFAVSTLFNSGETGNPTFLKVDQGVMSVFGVQGELLWQKAVIGIPDGRSDVPVNLDLQEKRYFSITDIDGNGKNVVLLSGPAKSTQKSGIGSDTIYCYEGDGSLRWRTAAGSLAVFGESGKTQVSRKLFIDWTTARAKDHAPRLFAIVRDYSYSPSKLAEIDTRTGVELSAYHNRGHAERLLATDVANDGKEELVWGGINDGFNQAFVAILDPENVIGHSPVPQKFHPVDQPPGSELYYILFPQSTVGKALSTAPYNSTAFIFPREGGGVGVSVSDFIRVGDTDLSGGILYSFTPKVTCINSVPGDGWLGSAQRIPESSNFNLSREEEKIRTLKDSLLYWNGDSFVKSPTPNKKNIAKLPGIGERRNPASTGS